MIKYFRAWLLVGLLGVGLPASASDPFFPSLDNKGINVIHYDLDINASSAKTFEAMARIKINPTERIEAFSLDLHGLSVRSVTIGNEAVSFSHQNDKLSIHLNSPRLKGKSFTVHIEYGGSPEAIPDPTQPDNPEETLGWKTYQNSAFVVSEPIGASTFFPANDQLDDRATYRIAVTVPAPLVAAANGRLEDEEAIPGTDRKRYRFEMKKPMSTWNATVQIGDFNTEWIKSSHPRGEDDQGRKIRFYWRQGTTAETRSVAARYWEIMDFLEDRFGSYPYPSDHSGDSGDSGGLVVIPDPSVRYALESQGLIQIPGDFKDVDEGTAVLAHELAHQWFGNSVAIRNWNDMWLAEGFATYAELLWRFRNDPAAYHRYMRSIYESLQSNNTGPAVIDSPGDLFSARTYRRGVMALYALELGYGQEQVQSLMKAWAKTHRHKQTVTTEAFISHVNRHLGINDWLEVWLYEPWVPWLDLPPEADSGTVPPDRSGTGFLRKGGMEPTTSLKRRL